MHLGDKSYLEGIVLTISTHSGPNIVFKCERRTPIKYLSSVEHKLYNDASDSEDEIDWSYSDDEAEIEPVPSAKVPVENLKLQFDTMADEELQASRRPSLSDSTELIFGFEAMFLSEMLCPPRSMCNKRFHLSIEDKNFLGLPVHVGEGGWKKSKEADMVEASTSGANTTTTTNNDSSSNNDNNDNTGSSSNNISSSEDQDPLRMFHVCFVLNPPITETQYVCDEIYQHVLVPFATLLRHEQRTKNYVWEQIKEISHCKDLGLKEDEINDKCELARALKSLFLSISNLEIAHLVISGKVRSFQIPVDSEVHRIPMFVGQDDLFYGCRPTTAKHPGKEIAKNCPDCYGLLLLDDPDKILKRIDAEPTGPLAGLVHKINPTLTLDQMAKENNISVKQMTNMAYSLVFWRCASIIIPLNHRFIYTVSPLAPMGRVYALDQQFQAQFPTMPPLQRSMSLLSTGKPQQFSNHIPSRDHHLVYMDVLAWMMRHTLAVHVQTFAIIFVPRKIKLDVLREDEEQQQSSSSSSEDEATTGPTAASSGQDFAHDNSTKKRLDFKADEQRWDAFENYEQLTGSYISNPSRASLLEKKWIFKIASKHSPESQALFYRMLKYFNGMDCLEQAFIHEKISRADQRRFLQEYDECICIYRHW